MGKIMSIKGQYKFLSIFLASLVFTSVNIHADNVLLTDIELTQIEDRVNDMTTPELYSRTSALENERSYLLEEQASSQSPAKQKAISKRLAEISAELSSIQKALVVVAGGLAISALDDDGYNDEIPP